MILQQIFKKKVLEVGRLISFSLNRIGKADLDFVQIQNSGKR